MVRRMKTEIVDWRGKPRFPSRKLVPIVIIFTEFRATQKWLFELLAARGFAREDRLLLLFGGMPKDKREEIKAAFQARPEQANVRILLATDAASEGIDLQNHCSRLIHYEIPWNPNRPEQRNGRIDRHGQRADEVQIFHFVPAGFDAQDLEGRRPGDLDGDLEFLARAVHKVQAIREDLGKVGPVIAQQVEDAMLGARARPLDTRDAERQAEPIKRMLTFERRLQEELERFREQLDETKRELHLAPERVQAAVETALALAGQPPLIPSRRDGIWPDPTGQRRRCPVFELPALRVAWGRCTVGLEHPHTEERRPIVFDPVLAKGRDDVVLAHLNHPLVDMSLRLLRAEIWKSGDNRVISRVTARLVPDPRHARCHWPCTAGRSRRRRSPPSRRASGCRRPDRAGSVPPHGPGRHHARACRHNESTDPGFARDVAELWSRLSQDLIRALEVRVNERTRNLEERFAARAEEEVQRLQTILEELARRIRESCTPNHLPSSTCSPRTSASSASVTAAASSGGLRTRSNVRAKHSVLASPTPARTGSTWAPPSWRQKVWRGDHGRHERSQTTERNPLAAMPTGCR